MSAACCYMASALCYDSHTGSKQERRYCGIFRVKSNQSKESAALRRGEQHNTTPVKWLSGADPGSVEVVPQGHVMSYKNALIQEAIMTAQAMGDGGPPCRGGPWSQSIIGSVAREEIVTVQRLAARARDPGAAREAVGAYSAGLSEAGDLKTHCENRRFRSDSCEEFMGGYKNRRTQTSGRPQSGCRKRYRAGLIPGSLAWEMSKCGGLTGKLTRRKV